MKVISLAVGPLQANCYVLIDPASCQACIIDPGAEAGVIQKALQPPLRVRYLIATHAHFDHVGALADLKAATGAPFWMHRGDLELLRTAPEAVRAWLGQEVPPPPEPDGFLEHGQRLELGELVLEVRHTPGHSPGSVSLVVEGNPPAVFAGDALFAGSIGRTDLPGGSFQQLAEAIGRELLTLEDGTLVYPGHGPTTTIGQERRSNPFLAQRGR